MTRVKEPKVLVSSPLLTSLQPTRRGCSQQMNVVECEGVVVIRRQVFQVGGDAAEASAVSLAGKYTTFLFFHPLNRRRSSAAAALECFT